jgi:hypothetical protein
MEQTLEEIVFQYRLLRQQVNSRQISPEQYVQAVTQLQGVDHFGYYWRIDPQKNTYLRFDGVAWIITPLPLGLTANSNAQAHFIQPPVPPAHTGQNELPATTPTPEPILPVLSPKSQRFFSKYPLVAFLPLYGFIIFWFFYTLPSALKGEGMAGVDWYTPSVLGILPLLLWLLRRRLKGLANIAQALLKPFPRALKIILPLMLPIVLGCGCGLVTRSGYLYLAFVTGISILYASLAFRVPDAHGESK